jgi:hypothetical protein
MGVGDLGQPYFWAENGGGFVWGDFGYPRYWAENGGGGLRNVKKLKQKRQKNKKS